MIICLFEGRLPRSRFRVSRISALLGKRLINLKAKFVSRNLANHIFPTESWMVTSHVERFYRQTEVNNTTDFFFCP